MRLRSPTSFVIAFVALVYFGCGGGGEEDEQLRVAGTAPADLEVGVPLETNVRAQLNADINPTTLSTTTFTLFEVDGAQVPGTVEIGQAPDIAVFTPDEPLTLITTYTATITTGLSDMSDRMLEEPYSWSFTTLDAGWGTPELIARQDLGFAARPQVAVDGEGNAHSVWEQFDGTRTGIWANRFTRIEGWGTAELIEVDDTTDAVQPQLAVGPNGVAHAVWAQSGGGSNIFANRYMPGQGWGTAELIQTGEVTQALGPQVAVDPDGNAIAVWLQSFESTGSVVWANRYTPSSGWGDAELIDSAAPGLRGLVVDVAMDANGNAVTVWTRGEPVRGENIWANRYTPSEGWGTAELIETEGLGNTRGPQVATDPDGNAHAVWQQFDGTAQNIWTNRYTPGEGWGSAELLETDMGAASRPAVTVDPTGVAHAVWSQSDDTLNNIWANRYTPGEGWGTPGLIETPIEDPEEEGSATSPRVSVDPNGNAFAVWEQETPIGLNIWSNHYTPGEGWATAELIEQEFFFGTGPQVAVDSDGRAHAVWEQSDGERINISTNRFQ